MSEMVRHPLDRPDPVLLVCESGQRWCDIARRFVGPFQHADLSGDSRQRRSISLSVQSIEQAKVRSALHSITQGAVLWEISNKNAPEIALAIAQLGVGRPDIMQLVAAVEVSREADRLLCAVLELGVRGIVRTPQEFASISPLIHRQFIIE